MWAYTIKGRAKKSGPERSRYRNCEQVKQMQLLTRRESGKNVQ